MHNIQLLQEPFDPSIEISNLSRANASMGAVVSFIGMMRDINEGDEVESMTLEHYPGMTESAINKIVEQAQQRWQLGNVTVIHRVGKVRPTDPIVLVAVTSMHRGEAFKACEFIIDFLKTEAPFWKKEQTGRGERWVEARDSDRDKLSDW
jgi:molybdopterin synthase catalytic subunit